MCGIVGYTGGQNASPILLEGLGRLEYRGYDSAGIAVAGEKGIAVCKVSGRVAELKEKIECGVGIQGFAGIGHTRWATHGAPTNANAHPHMSSSGKFAVVHNGIIENYMELRIELREKGFSFRSETDTEVVAHLLDLYYSGDVKDAVIRTVSRLRGSYALGIMYADEPDKLYAVREASPLILGSGNGSNYFASDVTALVPYTRDVIYLDDGELAVITPESMSVFSSTGEKVNKSVSRINWDIGAAEKEGYDHFMLKEIMEQPTAVKSAIDTRIKKGHVCFDEDGITPEVLNGINRILITACGSAYYAGCAGKYVIEKLCRIPVQTELASELRYSDPVIDEKTLLIVLSQSGETADTIAAMKECMSRGARCLAIVNVVGSTIAKLADYTLYTRAGPEIAVATTKGYTTQLALLYLFAVFAACSRQTMEEEDRISLTESLRNLPEKLRETIEMNCNIEALTEKYCTGGSVFFIGRNTDYAASLEGALKLKEISYIHAEAYAAGELKHGTIAHIDEGQPVIALCSNESIIDKTVSNIVEVKARGAKVLAVASGSISKVLSVADDVIRLPDMNSLFSGIAEVIPLQLFAYYTAKKRGCDIDKPKNLAKSVTVE